MRRVKGISRTLRKFEEGLNLHMLYFEEKVSRNLTDVKFSTPALFRHASPLNLL
jgi:hypothetical protein